MTCEDEEDASLGFGQANRTLPLRNMFLLPEDFGTERFFVLFSLNLFLTFNILFLPILLFSFFSFYVFVLRWDSLSSLFAFFLHAFSFCIVIISFSLSMATNWQH